MHTTSVFTMFNIKFKAPNVYRNYFTYQIIMECFSVYLYNTPMFAQSSLKQGTK